MPKQPGPQMRFVDRPEVSETFSDSLHSIVFDGGSMRIEFCITRMDEIRPPNPPTGRQYPVCRLVLTPKVAIDLFNRLQQMMAVLEREGKLKKGSSPDSTPGTVQ